MTKNKSYALKHIRGSEFTIGNNVKNEDGDVCYTTDTKKLYIYYFNRWNKISPLFLMFVRLCNFFRRKQ